MTYPLLFEDAPRQWQDASVDHKLSRTGEASPIYHNLNCKKGIYRSVRMASTLTISFARIGLYAENTFQIISPFINMFT
jgi:hypothetical protein